MSQAEKLDRKARLLLMSAYLYYQRASPVLTDDEYDFMAREVAARWTVLSPLRQWQLGSKTEVLATGHHFKITPAVEHGALSWHRSVFDGRNPEAGELLDYTDIHPEHGRWAALQG